VAHDSGRRADGPPPGADGLDPRALDALAGRARRDVERGELPSCQVALAVSGRLVWEATFGAPAGTHYVAFSCTKAITAATVWRLLGDGRLDVHARVAELVDGFGAGGKEAVTVEHLLTHTAGFPHAEMDHADWADLPRRLAAFASWPAVWPPGERFEYHATSASWVLAHLVEVVTGRDVRDAVREEVLDPLGLHDLHLGRTTGGDSPPTPAHLVSVGPPPSAASARSVGLDISAIGDDHASLLAHNEPAFRDVGQPAGGAVTRAGELAVFYQALLSDPLGLWDPGVLRLGTREVLCDLPDPMTGVAANRSLGLVVAGDDGNAMLRGFGRSVGPGAFGHMGAGGQIAWADPGTGLSMAYLTNGLERDPMRMGARSDHLSTLAGRCVGLGQPSARPAW